MSLLLFVGRHGEVPKEDDGLVAESTPLMTFGLPPVEGDMSPEAATSALSGVGEVIWTHVEDVATLFNKTADEFAHDTFKGIYAGVWIKSHEVLVVENPCSWRTTIDCDTKIVVLEVEVLVLVLMLMLMPISQ